MSGFSIPAPGRGVLRDALGSEQIVERIGERFATVTSQVDRGELTLHVAPDELVGLLTFCRDDDQLACALLADLSGVHWPAGEHVIERQMSTTGWPEHRTSREQGMIEVAYVLRSVDRNHWFRVVVAVSDQEPRLPSVVPVFETADFHEREVYDFFGVVFDGHPNMTRILMPDDWIGHPHRKDYPLGGVVVEYKNDKFIPSPEERSLREVVD